MRAYSKNSVVIHKLSGALRPSASVVQLKNLVLNSANLEEFGKTCMFTKLKGRHVVFSCKTMHDNSFAFVNFRTDKKNFSGKHASLLLHFSRKSYGHSSRLELQRDVKNLRVNRQYS